MDINLGTKIRELRKKKELTQEELATKLSVSNQAVSKWENGVANPDLSLIVPLAKALSVSTDELLGLESLDSTRKRKDELANLYRRIPQRNWKEGLQALDQALGEFPDDAWCLYEKSSTLLYAVRFDSTVSQNKEQKAAFLSEAEDLIRRSLTILDEVEGPHHTGACASILVSILVLQGRSEEAVAFAQTQPEERRNELLKCCLGENKLRQHHLRLIDDAIKKFLRELGSFGSEEAFDLYRQFLSLLYPQKNEEYYQEIGTLSQRELTAYAKQKKNDAAAAAYIRMGDSVKKGVELYVSKLDKTTPEPIYTHPLFCDYLTETSPSYYQVFNPYEMVASLGSIPTLKALKEREDFRETQALFWKLTNEYPIEVLSPEVLQEMIQKKHQTQG